MTTLVVLILLLLVVGALVFRPLLSSSFDLPTGPGLEAAPDFPTSRDRKRADNEIEELQEVLEDDGTHPQAHASAIDTHATEFLDSEAPAPGSDPGKPVRSGRQPGTYPVSAALGFVGVAVLATGAAFVAEQWDILRWDVRISANSRSESIAAQSILPLDADGSLPDIDAMVSRLEARILSGDVDGADIDMLVRSYTVLEREEEIDGFLRRALDRHPDHPVLRFGLAIRLYTRREPNALQESEALFDSILGIDPDNPVAQVYKGLIQAQRGEVESALDRLRRAEALVESDPDARALVSDLIERLSSPSDTDPQVGAGAQ